MYPEIGVVTTSRIPKGVLFGSLPTRLVKSECNEDGQKFGFVEVEYNNGELISQYGPSFNWMKYISPAKDEHEQNVEAFVDERGEISFEILQEIERGQELLYMFGKHHCEDGRPSDQQEHVPLGELSNKIGKHENIPEWTAGKHKVRHRNENIFKLRNSRESFKKDEQMDVPIEDNETTSIQLDYEIWQANSNFWLRPANKNLSTTTADEQEDVRQLPVFSESLNMPSYYPELNTGSYTTSEAEFLETTNDVKSYHQNDVNWYPLPVAITRPLGCTCTWSQPYLPSRKAYEYKTAYGPYEDNRPRSDDVLHRKEVPNTHPVKILRPKVVEGHQRTTLKGTFQPTGESKSLLGNQGERCSDNMTGYPQPRPEERPRRKCEKFDRTSEPKLIESHAQIEKAENTKINYCAISRSLEQEDNQEESKCSEGKQDETTNEKPKHESAKEQSSNGTIEEKISNDLTRSGSRFVCDYCGKSYCRRYVLKIHMRTHTGHKPLHCTVCWKSFGDPSNLKKHIRSHARKNAIYTCEHCGRGSFYRLCDLVRHIKFRHRLPNVEKWPNSSGGIKKQD